MEDTEYVDELEAKETEEHEFSTNYKLNSYGIDFDVNGLVRRLNSESIYLPDFQRNYVWNKNKASKFIESLLLGLPIPSICLYKEEDNKQIIIDGFQRLESIRLFYSGKFKDGSKFALVNVNDDFKTKTITDLDEDLKLKLDDTLIHATIVKADEPQEKNFNAVYLIFERLNTGGMNLTPQEIRSCTCHGPFQKVIQNAADNDNFKKQFCISPKRKKDQEIVLRMFALSENYQNYFGNMKEFLNEYMDSKKNVDSEHFNTQIQTYTRTMEILSNLDPMIFRPSSVLNIAILDAIFVGTYLNQFKIINIDISKYIDCINKMVEDSNFVKNIETGKTHHTAPLKERIGIAISRIGNIS